MELSNNKANTAEEYTLITQEKCSPPRAKLFMVTIVSLVVAILVVLLVVLTQVEKKPTATENYTEPDVCPDVAIVGGGLAGTYAAYQLVRRNLSIQIFDMTSRLGGRLLTKHFPNASGVNLEMGEAYWVPRLHRKMDQLVEELNLAKEDYIKNFHGKDLLYNLRNRNFRTSDLNGTKSPYNLDEKEKKRFPYELYRWYLEGDKIKFPDDNETESDRLNVRLDSSLADLLDERASPEGSQFIRATSEPYEFHNKGDSGMFFDYLLALGNYVSGDTEERYTVGEGMQEIAVKLLENITQTQPDLSEVTYPREVINMNRRLTKIESENGIHRLYFTLTKDTSTGTTDTRDTEFTCAKRVVLAISPTSLVQLNWPPLSSDTTLSKNLKTVLAVPMTKIFLAYNVPWWKQSLDPWKSVRTNLPLKRVDVISESNNTGELSVLMASFVAADNYDYWDKYLVGDIFKGSHDSKIPVTDKLVNFLQKHLSRLTSMSVDDLPLPLYACMHQWEEYPYGGAWHVWKPGSDWVDISNRMLKPGKDQNIHIVGGAFAPGHLQLSAEGALITVDNLIDNYFTDTR